MNDERKWQMNDERKWQMNDETKWQMNDETKWQMNDETREKFNKIKGKTAINCMLTALVSHVSITDPISKSMVEQKKHIYNYVLSVVKTPDEFIHASFVVVNVLKRQQNEKIITVALLHDIVEDGYANFEELKNRFNLDEEQMAALDAITRRQGERYFDYIERCKQNEIAKTVKLADLEHNIDRCVIDLPNRWGLLRRYAKAYGVLIDGK